MSHNVNTRPVEISQGGTGATTAAEARAELGASAGVVWGDGETWADVLPRLVGADFVGTLTVVTNSDFTTKLVTAGSYDFSKLKFVGGVSATNFSAPAVVELAEGVVLTSGVLDLTNIGMASTATATPPISTSSGIWLTLNASQIYSSSTIPFAALSGGNAYVYLYNGSTLGTLGLVAFFDITAFVNVLYYLYNGSGLGPFMQDDAVSQAQVTLDAGSHYYPWYEDPGNPNLSFTGIGGVSVTVVDIANGVRYKDSAVSPPLGADTVQGAIDIIKPAIAGLTKSVTFVYLTDQSAAIAATTIYSVPAPASGMYRISWVAKVTSAAGTSSVLGGTGLGLQVIYTDSSDSVVATTQANLSGATNAGNTTASTAEGVIVVSAAGSTDIQYKIGYTTLGGSAMRYSLHVQVEFLPFV